MFDGLVEVRDSKAAAGPVLSFGPDTWTDFITDVARGRFTQ